MTTAVAASLSVAEGQGPVGERELAFMRRALAAAELASGRGEVPVGAVVVVGGEIVSVAHNERETGGDPTAHAEILALRRAAAAAGRTRPRMTLARALVSASLPLGLALAACGSITVTDAGTSGAAGLGGGTAGTKGNAGTS